MALDADLIADTWRRWIALQNIKHSLRARLLVEAAIRVLETFNRHELNYPKA